MTTPIYADVTADLGWSPDELSPPLDVADMIRDSYHRTQPPHVALMAALDRLEVDRTWGRTRCERALREAGVPFTRRDLTVAVRERRTGGPS